jgi:hypothetical protein
MAREALRAVPDHPLAQAVRTFLLGDSVNLDSARAAARAHPNDWMPWLLVAHALRGGPPTDEFKQALDRVLVLAGSDPAVTLPPVALTK